MSLSNYSDMQLVDEIFRRLGDYEGELIQARTELDTRRENLELCQQRLIATENERNELRSQLAALSWAQWISVAERLPEESGEYLVLVRARHTGKEFHAIKMFNEYDQRWEGTHYLEYLSWMPLPPPGLP